MGSFAPLIVIGALLLVMVFFSNRSKAKRAAADVERRNSLVVGTRVMTTAGLHGTITAIGEDNDGSTADTVQLEIAPGVEVEWALAAVREAPKHVVLEPTVETTEVVDPTAGATAGGPVRMVKPKGRTGER